MNHNKTVNFFYFCTISVLLLLAHLSNAREFQRKVEFKDIAPTYVEAAYDAIPSIQGGNFGLADLDEALRFLMDTEKFDSVSVHRRQEGSYEVYLIKGRPKVTINEIETIGVTVLETDQISQILGLRSGERYNRQVVLRSVDELERFYQKKGYPKAKADISYTAAGTNQIDLQINVNEGPPLRIHEILISTANPHLRKELSNHLDPFDNEVYSEEMVARIKDSSQGFLRDNMYITARVENFNARIDETDNHATISFTIAQPKRYSIILQNNWDFSNSTLLEHLNLNDYQNIFYQPRLEIADKIRNFYLKKGYALVEVTPESQPAKEPFLDVIKFKIKEGHRVRIKDIQFQGRFSRSQDYYKDFVTNNSTDMVDRGFYIESDIEKGLENLKIHLQNHGYLRAKIISKQTEYIQNQRKAMVTVNLDEGPLTHLQSIRFQGNQAFTDQELKQVIYVRANSTLNLKLVDDSLSALQEHYLSRGYLEFKILNQEEVISYDEAGTTANIVFELQEGPQVKVAAIVVEGNEFTKDYVIRQEIAFESGDILTPQNIEESIRRLQRLGIFSRVDVTTLEQGSHVAPRTVIIRVEERKPGLLNFGIGVTNENELTLRGYTGISYRNLDGTARAVSLRVELNSNVGQTDFIEHKISTSYFEPFLGRTRTRGRLNLTRLQEVTRFDSDTDLPFIHESSEIEFLVEKELNHYLKLTWKVLGVGIIRNYLRFEPADPQKLATTGPTLEWDFRNSPVQPTSGSLTRWTTEYSSPSLGSSQGINYIKSTLSFTHYYTLPYFDLVWANSIRGGYLENLSEHPGSGVPEIKSFFLGGQQTIRGYEFNERFPDDELLNTNSSDEFIMTSISNFYLLKSELRIPINPIFGFNLFYDAGAVLIQHLDFDDPYRDALGAGIHFNTPVGPLKFEVGVKLDRRENESPYALHLFTFGSF